MATMADVAKRAGVSLSTVSYVLSGERPISETTRDRVIRAMAELDYSPNALARGLASRRSAIIALLLPTDESDADPFMAEVIIGAAEAARASDHHLLLWTEPAVESTGVRDMIRQGLIDGVLVMAVRLDDPRVDALTSAEVPFTLVGRTASPAAVPFVDTDEVQATKLTIQHLAELGHEHVAFLGPPGEQVERAYGIVTRTIEGLHAAAADTGIDLRIHSCERTSSAGRSMIRHVVESSPQTTAAIVMNDPALGGVLSALPHAGRPVPERFSVIGFFTTRLAAELTTPTLTTVAPSPTRIGQLAASTLIARLRDPDAPRPGELVPASLTIRDSTARAIRPSA